MFDDVITHSILTQTRRHSITRSECCLHLLNITQVYAYVVVAAAAAGAVVSE